MIVFDTIVTAAVDIIEKNENTISTAVDTKIIIIIIIRTLVYFIIKLTGLIVLNPQVGFYYFFLLLIFN